LRKRVRWRQSAAAFASLFLALAATPLTAQTVLTLEQAIEQAKGFSPTYLSVRNDGSAADWGVRAAYAQFVPSVTASAGGTWIDQGAQRFGTIEFFQTTQWIYSNYSLNFNLDIDGNTIFGVPNARAARRATEARISAAEFNLESSIAFQYMAVLRAQDVVDVAVRQRDRAQENRQLVSSRVSAGAAAGTDGGQAEVDLGRAEVALIRAEGALRQSRLQLAEQIGSSIDADVVLASEFDVFEPDFDLDDLLGMSLGEHPSLAAARAEESARRAAARQVSTSQYLPSIRLNGRLGGQAQQALNEDFILQQTQGSAASRASTCERNNAIHNGISGGLPGYTTQNCAALAYSDADGAAALAANNVFPFDFSSSPAQVGITVSLPIFTGFNRERQVSQANNAAQDAEYQRRSEELRLRTQVTNAYDNLATAYEVVQAESRNRALAEEQLQLQQRRYALGAVDLLVLMDAQTALSAAEQSYLNAVYDFHYNLIALEAAVGQPLRPR
jgi:outer membrane protein